MLEFYNEGCHQSARFLILFQDLKTLSIGEYFGDKILGLELREAEFRKSEISQERLRAL